MGQRRYSGIRGKRVRKYAELQKLQVEKHIGKFMKHGFSETTLLEKR